MDETLTTQPHDTPFRLKRSVVLVGMMGAGKTAIGKSLAERLGVNFADTDAAMEAASQSTIAEIFETFGEPFFRERETEVLTRLLGGAPKILSTGGGAFLAERNREVIAREGVALWLRASTDLLWERVRHKDTRPLLRTPNPRQTLEELVAARTPAYELAALQTEAQPRYSITDMTDAVVKTLLSDPEVLERK